MLRFARLGVQKRLLHSGTIRLSKRILCSDPIEDNCVRVLEAAGYSVVRRDKVPVKELLELVVDFDGLIVRSGTQVTKDIINAGKKLQLIGRAGTGVDNIDVDAATKRGIMVMNTPGGNTTSAAEMTLSLLFSLARHVAAADQSLKGGRWDRKKYTGIELRGKTLGVIGLGQIGRHVAMVAQAVGCQIIGYDPMMSAEVARSYNIESVKLEDIYKRSDFITLHTPLTNETRNLFNDATFAKCKKGFRIVNCARGGIIDEQALLRALNSGQCGGAALDVYESEPPPASLKPVLEHPKVICTPHLGASTDEAQEKVAQEIAEQFVDAFRGNGIRGVVNSRILSELYARKDLHPYVELAERLGNLQAQLLSGSLTKVSLVTRGEQLATSTNLLTSAALKGILSHMTSEYVNFINAPGLAKEFGIVIDQTHSVLPSVHGSSVTLQFETTEGTLKLVGSLVSGRPKVVQVDSFQMDVSPEGNWLVFKNKDRPGVIANVAAILGQNNINIANFALGRKEKLSTAFSVMQIDSDVNQSILDKLSAVDGMTWIRSTRLPEFTEADFVMVRDQPAVRPSSANFGSGPTKKRPGYELRQLNPRGLGRSHRSALGLEMLQKLIADTRRILQVPADYHVGIVPASDTGAFEMMMWSLLGARPVDVAHWESFGKGWMTDAKNHLKLQNLREFAAPYGQLPDLSKVNAKENDVLFTWNGTTSGVKVRDADWIPDDRQGLTLCDATSAVFAMRLPWNKLDVTTFSWQKALGGEGAHGMVIISPRVVQRLEQYTPAWPLPKIFRLTSKGKFDPAPFEGKVINTVSMLAVEDCLDALQWAESVGGLDGMISRSEANLAVLEKFVKENSWIRFLAEDKSIRSNTSVCLVLTFPPECDAKASLKKMLSLLENEGVAFDIGSYRDAPAGIRVWCGSTVETKDVEALGHWLKWGYEQVTQSSKKI